LTSNGSFPVAHNSTYLGLNVERKKNMESWSSTLLRLSSLVPFLLLISHLLLRFGCNYVTQYYLRNLLLILCYISFILRTRLVAQFFVIWRGPVYLYTNSWPIAVRQDVWQMTVALNFVTLQMCTEMESVKLYGSQQTLGSDYSNDKLHLLEAKVLFICQCLLQICMTGIY